MPRSLVRISYADIQSELRRPERASGTLTKRRDKLMAKLNDLEAQIARMGGSVNGRGRAGAGRRAKNDMTLTEALTKAIGGKSMSVTDAVERVQQLGYRSGSETFRTQVNIALIKSGKFKREGRGEYAVK